METFTLNTPFSRSYWVLPTVFLAGAFPGAKSQTEAQDKLERLIDAGVRRIINLMEPGETDHYGNSFNEYEQTVLHIAEKKGLSIDCLRFPVADLNLPTVPEMGHILDAITTGVDERKPVYVHCWGGIGRTGTVVGCYLLDNGLAHPDDVLEKIARLREGDPKNFLSSPETEPQRKFVLSWLDNATGQPTQLSRTVGCMLGGAVGDALGAPVEFSTRNEILRQFGPDGITAYAPAYGGLGTITDDTQMTLFTAEGLIRGWVQGGHKDIGTYKGMVARAYLRWLQTQDERPTRTVDDQEAGWLIRQELLHSRRAPGNTCLSALKKMTTPGEPARNNSKGCGGVMRMAPAGLFAWKLNDHYSHQEAFRLSMDLAAITHGHPTGALTGGVLAVMIMEIMGGATLADAIAEAKACLRKEANFDETLRAIELAEELAASPIQHEKAIARIGQGWIAEEALAISIYCALVARNFRDGVILAVNHDGDSDSTGSITGNLLGALYGATAIPQAWLEPLELRDVITELAVDLFAFRHWGIGRYPSNQELGRSIWQKYPGI